MDKISDGSVSFRKVPIPPWILVFCGTERNQKNKCLQIEIWSFGCDMKILNTIMYINAKNLMGILGDCTVRKELI